MRANALVALAAIAMATGAEAADVPRVRICSIETKLAMLAPNPYTASNNFGGNNYVEPQPSKTPVNPVYRQDVVAAFNIAPQDFKDALCALNQVFIDPNPGDGAPLGWGFWEGRNQGTGRKRFVGLSERVWQQPFNLTSLESGILTALAPRVPNARYSSAFPDDRVMAILSLLVHELGHVAYRTGARIPRECFTDTDSWRSVPQRPARFVRFGLAWAKHKLDPDYSQTMDAAALYQVHASGRWASLFSFLSPEEDFAETLKISVLVDVGLRSLQVEIPGYQGLDMIRYLSANTPLATKAACFRPYLVP